MGEQIYICTPRAQSIPKLSVVMPMKKYNLVFYVCTYLRIVAIRYDTTTVGIQKNPTASRTRR